MGVSSNLSKFMKLFNHFNSSFCLSFAILLAFPLISWASADFTSIDSNCIVRINGERPSFSFTDSVSWSGTCSSNGFATGKGIVKFYNRGTIWARYEGELTNGMFHGNGILSIIYPTIEDSYNGQWMNGKRHGLGKLSVLQAHNPDRFGVRQCGIYEGEWDDDDIIRGRVQLAAYKMDDSNISIINGDVYEGDFNRNGYFDGLGVLTRATGDVYKGEWWAGKQEGNGHLKKANGNEYDGQWSKGYMFGDGKLIISVSDNNYSIDGYPQELSFAAVKDKVQDIGGGKYMVYGNFDSSEKNFLLSDSCKDEDYCNNRFGTFSNAVDSNCKIWNPRPYPNEVFKWSGTCSSEGFAEGTGRLLGPKTAYQGEMLKGRKHGKGIIRFESGTCDGEFVDGFVHGKATCKWDSGSSYTGDLSHAEFDGYGIFKWKSGAMYEGQWQEGKRHGYGKLTFPKESHEIEKESIDSWKDSGTWSGETFTVHGIFANEKLDSPCKQANVAECLQMIGYNFFSKGVSEANLGNWDRAISEFKKIPKGAPDYLRGQTNILFLTKNRTKFDTEREAAQKAVKLQVNTTVSKKSYWTQNKFIVKDVGIGEQHIEYYPSERVEYADRNYIEFVFTNNGPTPVVVNFHLNTCLSLLGQFSCSGIRNRVIALAQYQRYVGYENVGALGISIFDNNNTFNGSFEILKSGNISLPEQ